MCGIAGAAGPDVGDPGLLARMTAAMSHRGPDGVGALVTPTAMLGCARLAIIDVDGGAQPIHDESGEIAVVCNGEIYNFVELRRRLEGLGHTFRTASDTECLVHLYEEHGADLVHHLRGMFAFGIWDGRRQRLVLGRDRVGKKPLYYRLDGGRLWFASELKALLADPTFARAIDPVSLDQYLTLLWVPGPRSILQDVHRVPPGHTLTFERGTVDLRRYWLLDHEPKANLTDEEATDQLAELLREATRLRMVAERPLGAFLSGGLDSSLVVATMAGLSSTPVQTFSVGFDDDAFDERPFARTVAERFATDHHEIVVKPDPTVVFDRPAVTYDEPFGDPSAVPSLELARLAHSHVTVALNGDGGDESFGGYGRYAVTQLAAQIPVPRSLARIAGRLAAPILAGAPPGSTRSRVRTGLRFVASRGGHDYPAMTKGFPADARAALYTADLRQATVGSDAMAPIRERLRTANATNDIDRLLAADVDAYLPDDLLVKMDMATMAHSVEARSPFLDHELMTFAARLPETMKVRRAGTRRERKFLLKRLARRVLPPEIVDRRKLGFAVPVAAWLREDLRDPARDLLTDRTARDRGLFEPGAVVRLLDEHDAGLDRADQLWGLLRFELWCREHLDGHGG